MEKRITTDAEKKALMEEFKGDFALIYSKPSGLRKIWVYANRSLAVQMHNNVLNSWLGEDMPYTLVIEGW